mmetsp:Transcript_15385/g.17895  ORF Transcript_15385/g.17895 Transcript_15385/m.17895 type:complete len:81 (-) Transcript_15385:12-254(-)
MTHCTGCSAIASRWYVRLMDFTATMFISYRRLESFAMSKHDCSPKQVQRMLLMHYSGPEGRCICSWRKKKKKKKKKKNSL